MEALIRRLCKSSVRASGAALLDWPRGPMVSIPVETTLLLEAAKNAEELESTTEDAIAGYIPLSFSHC